MHSQIFLLLPVLFIVLSLLYRLSQAFFSPLKDIPGPFWARFTTLWYFRRVQKGGFEHDNISLHQKYGPVVRVAPNKYSISESAAIRTIYGTGSRFAKSAWYDAWKHPAHWTVFSDRDIKRHCEFDLLRSGWILANVHVSRYPKALHELVFYEFVGPL
jgi:hypothetical protein